MIKNWFKESVSAKLIVVSILVLLLLIPVQMIKSLIREREYTRNDVVNEIGDKWAKAQTINGPIITIPYLKTFEEDDKLKYMTEYAHFLPEDLNIDGTINPEIRYRGIYKAIVYTANMNITGHFSNFDFGKLNISASDVFWDEAYLSIGIPDMRGISKSLELKFDEEAYEVDPGIRSQDVMRKGISSPIKIKKGKTKYSFNLNLGLRGSESINFIPTGKTTSVKIISDWEAPSFTGAFLPSDRTVNNEGFKANWLVLHLNRSYPQQWTGAKYNVHESSFGIDLLLPVNQYLKSERAIKYALMFIALTFLVFFFTEVLNKKRIHPIQYLMVGFGLVVFYTLLISLSEHISFALSYLIASSSVILLITLYTKATIKKNKTTLSIAGILVALYVFLYTILQLEAYSLLMGSVGLFVALALVMFLSRKVDWNSSMKLENKED